MSCRSLVKNERKVLEMQVGEEKCCEEVESSLVITWKLYYRALVEEFWVLEPKRSSYM